MTMLVRLLLILAWLRWDVVDAEDAQTTNTVGGCDDDSVSDSVPITKLAPNKFYKICPSQLKSGNSESLGQPICGDGTNFAFFVTKPIQRKANNEKVLIEFMGGGACWNDETCGYNAAATTFPEALNAFVGYSCSEVAYSTNNLNGYPINLLCAQSIGSTDFTEYTSIVVPYCTQDIHIGDQTITYEEGLTMNHRGGHNTMGVLRWVFKNFPNPSRIFLTGCSAGGAVLPIVHDLLRKHYSRVGRRTVQISTIGDSPVYLTPSYFLQNYFGNWFPDTMMNKVGFNFYKWRYASDYPTRVWSHILKRGTNKDQWGFVSHTEDPISLIYYQWMSGQGGDNDRHRKLNDGDDDQSRWYNELSTSLSTIQKQHKNVATYWIESEGHCSFGLYYPLQEEGFDNWASQIVQEQRIGSSTPAPAFFFLSIAVGALTFVGVYYSRRRSHRNIDVVNSEGFLDDTTIPDDDSSTNVDHQTGACCEGCIKSLTAFPITASYAVTITIYLMTMIISQGFAHPLNNPSLGPSAISLSRFGINNPSLIVYRGQVFRLLVSSLLCSGLLTYAIVLLCLWFFARPLEKMLHNHLQFGCILFLLAISTNIVFALFGNGASCSTVGLAMGLNTVYIILRRRLEDSSIVGITFGTVFMAILVIVVFPFNNWIMLITGIVVGVLTSMVVIRIASKETSIIQDDGVEIANVDVNPVKISRRAASWFCGTLFVMFLVLLFRLRRPNHLYMEPFYTGCNVMYAAGDDVTNIINKYGSSFRRKLEGDADNVCAEFCIPHIASKATLFGARRLFSLPLTLGECEDIGFDVHMADKTVQVSGYSLDFEIFTMAEEAEDREEL